MSLNKAKLVSLKDKLEEIQSKEIPTDAPVVEEKTVEEKRVKKEIKKVKGGK